MTSQINKNRFIPTKFIKSFSIILIVWISLFLIFLSTPDNRYFINPNKFNILGLVIYLFMAIIIITIFLFKYEKELVSSNKQLYLFCFLIVLGVLINRVTLEVSPFFSLTPAIIMLLTIFINGQVAMISALSIIISSHILLSNNFLSTAMNLISSILAIFMVSKLNIRFDLVKAGISLSLVNILTILVLSTVMVDSNNYPLIDLLIYDKSTILLLGTQLLWGGISGITSSIIAIGLIPYLESLFSLTTVFKLLELLNPEQPLLKKLAFEASGTYQHSILVANLAESAAEAINADRLLTRVGAYYHDIGKIKRPHFFIENQIGGENNLYRTPVKLSAQVVIGHVKEGVALAKEYNLPIQIQDIISQHHGTTLVSYFYHQAKYEESDVQETDFKYPGPKPQSKEAGIIMLADASEAAVRTLNKPSLEVLEQTVKKIIKSRLDDGQLDDTPLTLNDLEKIEETLIKMLQGIYHRRIEYPQDIQSSDTISKKIKDKPKHDLSD